MNLNALKSFVTPQPANEAPVSYMTAQRRLHERQRQDLSRRPRRPDYKANVWRPDFLIRLSEILNP